MITAARPVSAALMNASNWKISPLVRRGLVESGADERAMVEALRRGDERVFETLVERYHGSLIRIALMYVRDRAIAEEVAQETWR